MGTPSFAVSSLDALVKVGFNIVAVITAPDKPAGRGQKVSQSAVKIYAEGNGIPVLQPQKLKDPEFILKLKSLNADLQVVVAFRMLPEIVWNMPAKGTINLHASLLPQYRGAAPINWVIINGEKTTGITTFFLKHEIDTGDILFAEKVSIGPQETAGELHDKLMIAGSHLLVQTVKAIQSGDYNETSQDNSGGKELLHAPKLFKEDSLLNWNLPALTVYNRIRGLSPYPTAYTFILNKSLKIFHADLELAKHELNPGTHYTDGKTFLKFACPDGFISVRDVQIEGKKRMKIDEFLRGVRL